MTRTIGHHFRALSLVLAAGALSAFAQDRPSVFQSWNEVQLIVPLIRDEDGGKTVDKITAVFNGVARIGRGELIDGRLGGELDFRANKHVTFVTSILERTDELVDNQQHSEIRLAAGATFTAVLKEFSFRDRNLYERRFRAGRDDISVYRQRLQISHPLRHDGKVLFSPFLSEELFYDMSVDRINNNELFLGVTRSLNARTALDIAYIRNDIAPTNANGLSLTFKITCDDPPLKLSGGCNF